MTVPTLDHDFSDVSSTGSSCMTGMTAISPRICVVVPYKPATSETFIRAHTEKLQDVSCVICGDGQFHASSDWLKEALRNCKPDVVLAEYGPTGVVCTEVCHDLGIPLVVRFAGFDAFDERALAVYSHGYSDLFKYAAKIVVVSNPMIKRVIELGAPRRKVQLCPSGADPTLFTGAEPVKAPPLIIAVGRFVDKKAPQLTLHAFAKVIRQVSEARLLMIGDGPLLECCRELAEATGIGEKVEFPGALDHSSVAAALRNAAVFVQHSVTTSYGDSEGTPNTVMEAAACGLPVVATRSGGIPTVIRHERDGFLVVERDCTSMADYLARLLLDRPLAAKLGASGRKRVKRYFSQSRSLRKLHNILVRAAFTGSSCSGPKKLDSFSSTQ